jgi:hypothetical protein
MNKHWGLCLGLVALAGLALLAGLPAYYLLVLACPLMMVAMMAGMGGMHGTDPAPRDRDADADPVAKERSAGPRETN